MTADQFVRDPMGIEAHPTKSNLEANGIYSIRNGSKTSGLEEKPYGVKELDLEDSSDVSNELKQEGDIRKKQVYSGWVLFWLAYQSTGVIYGDIGTSPLYVYSSTFSSQPSYDDLLGALSIIIWSLTLIVSIKYVFIVLRADDEGEGGTFALYSQLSRYAHIVDRDPKEESMIEMKRYMTQDVPLAGRKLRSGMENSNFVKGLLKVFAVLGVSLVMADGVLTPAQSVLGAIQGLVVVSPSISLATVTGVSCAILVLLFLIQPFGTAKLASAFAPIVIIWLSFNAGFGIYNLVYYDHTVLKAFSPYFAGAYLVRGGYTGWSSLGGLLLAFTGVEAMFADLGAFSMRAIQLSWMCFTFPCLLLGYIGQAAYISQDATGNAITNPFFYTVPPGMLYPSLVIAILAAIVASQAMITSTFQLLSQIMKLSYFPQIKVVHTSKIFHGQIYIPIVNWLLMIGTVIVTAAYNNTTRLGNAYGVCVVMVTFITTCMVTVVALIIWRVNPFIVAFVAITFALLDGAYLSSVLIKVPQGAWLTLAIAVVLMCVFILWRFGKEQQWKAEAEDRFNPSHLVTKDESGALRLTPKFGSYPLTSIKGLGIFFDKTGEMTPHVFIHFLSKFHAAPEIIVFFHLRPLSTPSVTAENRYTITRTAIPHCFRLVIRHGYMDEVITPDLAAIVYAELRNYILRAGVPAAPLADFPREARSVGEGSSNSASETGAAAAADGVAAVLAKLHAAYEAQVIYIVGKEQMRIKAGTNALRFALLSVFLWLRENTRSKMASMKIPVEKSVEVGFVKDV